MGPESAAAYGRRNAVPPEMVVRVRPDRVVAKVDVNAQPIIWLAVSSDNHSTLEISDYADRILKERLQRLPGGVAMNIAMTLVRFGLTPALLTAIGRDAEGDELVALVRDRFGDGFHIEVAAYPEMHPQALSFERDLDNFKRKVDAGADSAITQYFYNADAYEHFSDACVRRGIDIPIVPGIMPITNFSNLVRFSDACGAEIPRWLRKRLEAFGDDIESIRALGVDVVTHLCERLLGMQAQLMGIRSYT